MSDQLDKLQAVIDHYEKSLSYRSGGDVHDRLRQVLSEYQKITDNTIFQAKNFVEDVKTQFKALEIITEGISENDLNHGQKRVIANHVIKTLRRMVDRLDQLTFEYNTNILERYNFFRSYTPERRLYEQHADLSRSHDRLSDFVKTLREKHPEVFKNEQGEDLPF